MTGYNADMTRTVVKGEPDIEIIEMYEAVMEAQERAISIIRSGIVGASVHQEIVDLFKEKGYESNSRGFMHNLGHGVGLDIHEKPVLGPGGSELMDGNVITVEPGLYYKGKGGVRLEDMGAVTSSGFDRFTSFEKILTL
jgi:Xaa-Pro aminopeptidase